MHATPAGWPVDMKIVSAEDLFGEWATKEASMETLKAEKTWNMKVTPMQSTKTRRALAVQTILPIKIEKP